MHHNDWKEQTIAMRNTRGSSFVEAILVAMILIPLALCMLDLIMLVIANSINDQAAKNAARAAANQPSGDEAYSAAQNAMKTVHTSNVIKSIKLIEIEYNKDTVSCKTEVVVQLPVPFPGWSVVTFQARDVEPVLVKAK